jgi:small subunit ribosomal protein S6
VRVLKEILAPCSLSLNKLHIGGRLDQKEVKYMRKYEVMYIIRTDIEQEQVQATVEKFQNIITNGGGEITKHDVMGKRRLAYEINKFRDGHYLLVHFNAEPSVVTELDRVLKISDEIIRFLIVKDVA